MSFRQKVFAVVSLSLVFALCAICFREFQNMLSSLNEPAVNVDIRTESSASGDDSIRLMEIQSRAKLLEIQTNIKRDVEELHGNFWKQYREVKDSFAKQKAQLIANTDERQKALQESMTVLDSRGKELSSKLTAEKERRLAMESSVGELRAQAESLAKEKIDLEKTIAKMVCIFMSTSPNLCAKKDTSRMTVNRKNRLILTLSHRSTLFRIRVPGSKRKLAWLNLQ